MLAPPTSTQVRDAEIFRTGTFPAAVSALGPEQMLAVNRRLFLAAPGCRERELCRRATDLLQRQKLVVSANPDLATGFELNNFHSLAHPEAAWFVNKERHAAVQHTARTLGFDTAQESCLFAEAQAQYKLDQDETAYEQAAMRYFYDFLRPLYQALRRKGLSHGELTA